MKTKKLKTISNLDIFKLLRKPMPPPTQVTPSKKVYNRKNKSWKKENNNGQ